MQKELIEKLHAKLMKVVDENCRGVDFRQLKLNKVSPKVFDLEVVIEGMVGSALFSANLPTKYSNMKILSSPNFRSVDISNLFFNIRSLRNKNDHTVGDVDFIFNNLRPE